MCDRRNLNVLVVDDSRAMCSIVSQLVSKCGYQVTSVQCMEDALDLCENSRIDLVLTDILMPGMGGLTGIIQIRETWPNIGIIAMTGGGKNVNGKSLLSAARQVGADDILGKPFTEKQLMDSIDTLLAGYSEKGRKRKVLVIDDSSTIRKMLSTGLNKDGFQCATAPSIEEALDCQDIKALDVVVCDIFMPGMGGLAGIALINMDWPNVKIIAISGGCGSADRDEALLDALQTGAHDYMQKPFDLPDLTEKINGIVDRLDRRFAVSHGSTTLTMPDGSKCPCEVNDISAGGANIIAEIRPKIGNKVMVGKTEAKVVRHTDDGIAVEFNRHMHR